MHVKRYEAPSALEAIRQVKAELGADALILSQRTVRRRSRFGLLGRSVVEITAAVDREVRRASTAPDECRVTPDPSWQELAVRHALNAPIEHEVRQLRDTLSTLTQRLPDGDALRQEISALRSQISEQTAAVSPTDAPETRLLMPLLDAGIHLRHARPIAADVGPEGATRESITQALSDAFETRFVPDRPDATQALVLVGATGVGKTTTLAKIAARYAPESVALVSLDSHRLGGDAALRGYAQQRKIPCNTVTSADGLCNIAREYAGRKILVDTPGTGPKDVQALGELDRIPHALACETAFQIVVSATTKEDDLRGEIARFRRLQLNRMIVTKTDESTGLENIANIVLDSESPALAWIGSGPHVPDDLRIPDPSSFAHEILEVPR